MRTTKQLSGEITAHDKLAECKRELEARMQVYPRLIAKGTLNASEASRRMDILRAIAADYARASNEGLAAL